MVNQTNDQISNSEPETPTTLALVALSREPRIEAEEKNNLKDHQVADIASSGTESLNHVEGTSDDSKPRSKLRSCSTVLMLCLVLFVSALDQTIVATAIPSITHDLHSAAGYTWIGGAYLLANNAGSPMWVRFSDIWGRKVILLAVITVFAVGSVLAAAAVNMTMLIVGRSVQGFAGGGIIQLVYVTISDLFSVRHRTLYISITGLVWVLAGTTGPVIGGALSQHASWRWCFWINLPVCGLAFLVLLLFLDLHNPRTKLGEGLKAIDWFGTVCVLATVLLLLLGLDFGGVTFAWNSPTVICMLVFGGLLIGVFLLVEKRVARFPLVHLNAFQDRSNVAVVLVSVAHAMATRGAEYYLPLYFQSVKEASPTASGVLILPMMVSASFCDILAGVLVNRLGRYREIIWVGAIFLTLGSGLYVLFDVNSNLGEIIGYQIIAGIGLGLLLPSPMIAIQNTVSQSETAVTTATLGFTTGLAVTLTIVLGGVVFQDSMTAQRSSLAAAGLSQFDLAAFSGYDAAANVDLIPTIKDPAQQLAVQNAYAHSMRNMFIMYTAIAGVGLLASPFIKQRHMSKEHTETKTGIKNMVERKRKLKE